MQKCKFLQVTCRTLLKANYRQWGTFSILVFYFLVNLKFFGEIVISPEKRIQANNKNHAK